MVNIWCDAYRCKNKVCIKIEKYQWVTKNAKIIIIKIFVVFTSTNLSSDFLPNYDKSQFLHIITNYFYQEIILFYYNYYASRQINVQFEENYYEK